MKILYVYADDVFFWRNRLQLACETQHRGCETVLLAPVGKYIQEIERQGIRTIPWRISRKSVNPLREILSLRQVVRVLREEQPDLVQSETLKAVMHAGVAGKFCGNPRSVHIICGLGAIFSRDTPKMLALRQIVPRILASIFSNTRARAVFLNPGDREALTSTYRAVAWDQTRVVSGNGVDTEYFRPSPETTGEPIVVLPGRMLAEKGVYEFVEAARILKAEGRPARFVLVGSPDLDNPGQIPEEQLISWGQSGLVEWWGNMDDMASVYAKSTIVCLPSYAEGLPNVLTEAGASERAVIASDVPGCREAVADGVNGLLVPPRDSKALAAAIDRLLNDRPLRRQLAGMNRRRAVEEFSLQVVSRQMFAIYRDLLGEEWPGKTDAEQEAASELLAETAHAGS